jgi:hypothetical protein
MGVRISDALAGQCGDKDRADTWEAIALLLLRRAGGTVEIGRDELERAWWFHGGVEVHVKSATHMSLTVLESLARDN